MVHACLHHDHLPIKTNVAKSIGMLLEEDNSAAAVTFLPYRPSTCYTSAQQMPAPRCM